MAHPPRLRFQLKLIQLRCECLLNFDPTRLLMMILTNFSTPLKSKQPIYKPTQSSFCCNNRASGEWPNSVLSMEKTKYRPETTAQQKPDGFSERPEIILRRATRGTTLSAGVRIFNHEIAKSIDHFTFRFKNNLHHLSKLVEPVDRNLPQFITSQVISKTKPDIKKHLVLKAEEYKGLSEIVEAAKRIERLFSPVHSPPKPPPILPNAFATNPTSVTARGRGGGLDCHHCGSAGHIKSSCPEKIRKNNTFAALN